MRLDQDHSCSAQNLAETDRILVSLINSSGMGYSGNSKFCTDYWKSEQVKTLFVRGINTIWCQNEDGQIANLIYSF